MTNSPVQGPGTSGEVRPPAHRIVRAALREAGATAALVVIYYLLPLDHSSTGVAVAVLVAGLVALIGLIAFQVRSILVSPSRACGLARPRPPAFRCSSCCSPAPIWS
jgi:voltage-gated potassium channel